MIMFLCQHHGSAYPKRTHARTHVRMYARTHIQKEHIQAFLLQHSNMKKKKHTHTLVTVHKAGRPVAECADWTTWMTNSLCRHGTNQPTKRDKTSP